ncbi:shikimate dehydrogenase [Desulfococcaceae bacterium HSG8]|nr:shikimate dehydrogenase [Desulfococcaceae bacterium HSG8]
MQRTTDNGQRTTKVFCILGDERIFSSKSPDIFSTVMKEVGVKGTYVPFMVKPERIGEAMRSLCVLNIAGANVTVPYKEAVIPYMDELSEGATIIGSVNTIVRDGEKLKGYNTNAIGFMDALEDAGFEAGGKSAIVFGTGGAARAVIFMLKWLHASSILVTGRNEKNIRHVVNRVGGEEMPLDALPNNPVPANIVINATSVSSPDESSEMAALVKQIELPECEMVVDLNYGRSENFWEDMARTKGIRFMDGLSSLANQARRTFALWTGIHVSPELFLKSVASGE